MARTEADPSLQDQPGSLMDITSVNISSSRESSFINPVPQMATQETRTLPSRPKLSRGWRWQLRTKRRVPKKPDCHRPSKQYPSPTASNSTTKTIPLPRKLPPERKFLVDNGTSTSLSLSLPVEAPHHDSWNLLNSGDVTSNSTDSEWEELDINVHPVTGKRLAMQKFPKTLSQPDFLKWKQNMFTVLNRLDIDLTNDTEVTSLFAQKGESISKRSAGVLAHLARLCPDSGTKVLKDLQELGSKDPVKLKSSPPVRWEVLKGHLKSLKASTGDGRAESGAKGEKETPRGNENAMLKKDHSKHKERYDSDDGNSGDEQPRRKKIKT